MGLVRCCGALLLLVAVTAFILAAGTGNGKCCQYTKGCGFEDCRRVTFEQQGGWVLGWMKVDAPLNSSECRSVSSPTGENCENSAQLKACAIAGVYEFEGCEGDLIAVAQFLHYPCGDHNCSFPIFEGEDLPPAQYEDYQITSAQSLRSH